MYKTNTENFFFVFFCSNKPNSWQKVKVKWEGRESQFTWPWFSAGGRSLYLYHIVYIYVYIFVFYCIIFPLEKIWVSWRVQRRKIKVFVHLRNPKREEKSCLVRGQQQNLSVEGQNFLTPPTTKSRANNRWEGKAPGLRKFQIFLKLAEISDFLTTFTYRNLHARTGRLWDYFLVLF